MKKHKTVSYTHLDVYKRQDKESTMEYGKLGNTDIEVSKLCVGCMSFGKAGTMHNWTLDEAESENVIKHALDRCV